MLARGESMGPLHGFPHAVKDLQPVKGLQHTDGTTIFRNRVATTDGLMVSRLRKAGVIFIGKTNTPEFGLGSHTYNSVYGKTRNAWNQDRSPAGSRAARQGMALALRHVAVPRQRLEALAHPAAGNNV